MKTLILSLITFFAISSASAQEGKSAEAQGWHCRTFTVEVGWHGFSISTTVEICCGCMMTSCNCTVNKTAGGTHIEGHLNLDNLYATSALPQSNKLTVGSSSIEIANDGGKYSVVPGEYSVIDENGHKVLIVDLIEL